MLYVFLALGALLAGFVALYFGAEWLVDGAAEVASHLKLSKSFVGLTLVAFGTSAPELFVNVIAATRNHTDLALSNIAGSNLTNLCVGFGISSLFCVVPLRRQAFLTDTIFVVVTPAVVLMSFLLTQQQPQLSIWSLIPFVLLLSYYLYSLSQRRVAAEVDDPTHMTLTKPLLLFGVGVVALYFGGELVFRSTTYLAKQVGISESILGLTVVACGTSIPDVTASIVASRKGEFEIAVGNLLGSNISNILVVLAGTLIAARSSLSAGADWMLVIDYAVVCAMAMLFAVIVARTQRVTRVIGVGLLVGFLIYYGFRVTGAMLGGAPVS